MASLQAFLSFLPRAPKFPPPPPFLTLATQATPACAWKSLLGKRSCQVMPKNLMRQAGRRCCVCALGGSRGSRSRRTTEQRTRHEGLVHLHLGAEGQHGVVSDPHTETCHCCCCCLANSFACSVQCLRRGCWRCWSLGK